MNGDMGIKIPGLVEAETWMSGETVEHVKDELLRQPWWTGYRHPHTAYWENIGHVD